VAGELSLKRQDCEVVGVKELDGKISDRIRSGEIPADNLSKGRDLSEQPPSDDTVRSAEGHGLGKGATTARNGGAS
jgi:hypothetical protein